jgi:hypothetical protein
MAARAAAEPEPVASAATAAFMRGQLDFSLRPAAPAPGWAGMPECLDAERVAAAGGTAADVRLLLTFTAAMDRARDVDRLWAISARLFERQPWTFDPAEVSRRPLLDLADALPSHCLSQRHGADAAAIADDRGGARRPPQTGRRAP